MNIPAAIWNSKLENGQILAEFVSGGAPSQLHLSDLSSFSAIWNSRLLDAQRSNSKDVEKRAKSILRFLSEYKQEDIHLLMWPKHGVSALYTEHHNAFVLIDETRLKP